MVLTMSKGKPWSETRLMTHVLLLVLRNTWGGRQVSASCPGTLLVFALRANPISCT